MKPTLALIGRPNVGKSTLFNRLTRSRDALVADLAGLTRDRHYGHGHWGNRSFLVIDTGGFEPQAADGILYQMARQTEQALLEADAVLFIVDGRQGLSPTDREIADLLRRSNRPVWVAVNKTEGMDRSITEAEFHELGLGRPYAISSAHGDGVAALLDLALASFPVSEKEEEPQDDQAPKIAIVGRPNVGKSTLINALVGEERVIAFDEPGTTRDSISIDFQREGRDYTLIDTAGIRRKGRVFEAIEKFSVIKTLQAIEEANVVILMVDARQDVSDQDAHLAGFIAESGRALVVAVNKWEKLDAYTRDRVRLDVDRRLAFLAFARFHYISALQGNGLAALFRSVDSAYQASMAKLPTPKLTRILIDATTRHPPPRQGIFRPKMRYAHQGGRNPPVVIVHGNALDKIADSYRRYLEATFREAFKLEGTPLRIEFKIRQNPYIDDSGKPRSRGTNKARTGKAKTVGSSGGKKRATSGR